jgi:hypothetical protein
MNTKIESLRESIMMVGQAMIDPNAKVIGPEVVNWFMNNLKNSQSEVELYACLGSLTMKIMESTFGSPK